MGLKEARYYVKYTMHTHNIYHVLAFTDVVIIISCLGFFPQKVEVNSDSFTVFTLSITLLTRPLIVFYTKHAYFCLSVCLLRITSETTRSILTGLALGNCCWRSNLGLLILKKNNNFLKQWSDSDKRRPQLRSPACLGFCQNQRSDYI